jgi:hypothetical protein
MCDAVETTRCSRELALASRSPFCSTVLSRPASSPDIAISIIGVRSLDGDLYLICGSRSCAGTWINRVVSAGVSPPCLLARAEFLTTNAPDGPDQTLALSYVRTRIV